MIQSDQDSDSSSSSEGPIGISVGESVTQSQSGTQLLELNELPAKKSEQTMKPEPPKPEVPGDKLDKPEVNQAADTPDVKLPQLPQLPQELPEKLPQKLDEKLEDLKLEHKQKSPEVTDKEAKITVRLKPIGSTKPINPQTFKVSKSQTVQVIIKFLCNKLRVTTIYMYINNSFQPNPDENLGQLFRHFSSNNELIINYCNTIDFG